MIERSLRLKLTDLNDLNLGPNSSPSQLYLRYDLFLLAISLREVTNNFVLNWLIIYHFLNLQIIYTYSYRLNYLHY